jgi:hypothetical protein
MEAEDVELVLARVPCLSFSILHILGNNKETLDTASY